MLIVIVVADTGASTSNPWQRPAVAPAPADNHLTVARVELGRALFFDPRLSAKGAMSCASCHNPALGWSDGLSTAVGHDMKMLGRATPTIVNAAFNPLQMWDGRKASLEEQALGPFGADEQNLPLEELEQRVQSIAGYGPMFAEAYPGEPITRTTIAKAIASFERTVLSEGAPFDRWRRRRQRCDSAGGATRLRSVRRQGELRSLPPGLQLHRQRLPQHRRARQWRARIPAASRSRKSPC